MDHPTAKNVKYCLPAGSPSPTPPTPPPPPPTNNPKSTPKATAKATSPATFKKNVKGESINKRITKSTKPSTLPLPIIIPTSNGTNPMAVELALPGSTPPSVPQPVKRPSINPEDDTVSALKEMFLPVMLSGFGNLGAGLVLERVQVMEIFMAIPQLIQLVPPLLGLKGNVEMTLASRLSTHANLGHLSDKKTRRRIICGNIALCQFLATGVGFIAPMIALLLSHFSITGHPESASVTPQPLVSDSHFSATPLLSSSNPMGSTVTSSMVSFEIDYKRDFVSPALTKSLLVVAIFLATSGLADVILSSTITCVVIICTQYLGINADNVATPIAASVGDLMTMCFLVFVSDGLYRLTSHASWVPLVPLILWTIIVIFTGIIARRNPFTRSKVFHGWSPLVVSMLLQNVSGIIMENSLRRFPRMASYQPIINGFGGNLVAIQSSRVATYLHKHAPKRELVNESDACCHSPLIFFCGEGQHGKLAFLMVLLAGPIQLPLVIISTFASTTSQITVSHLLTYYACATLQIIIILYIGYCFVNLLWLFGANPDDNAIPILTALADLLGTIILVGGYMFLDSIGDPNSTLLDQSLPPTTAPSTFYNATSINGNLTSNPLINYLTFNNGSLFSTPTPTTTFSSLLSSTIPSQLTSTLVTTLMSTTLPPITTTANTTINKLTSSIIGNLTKSPTTIKSTNITF